MIGLEMRAVPGAVATGSALAAIKTDLDYPVATAPGTDFIGHRDYPDDDAS